MSDGRVYWFATQNAKEGQRDNPVQTKAHLQQLFHGWHDPIESLLETTDESAILRNDIYDRDPIASWSKNRVTLLGDAAHPTTPNLGQGGCQAIEDAALLAECLATNSTVGSAFGEYQTRRMPRTKQIVLSSRRIGDLAQLENPFLSFLRNVAVRATPRFASDRQLNSIVAFEPLTDRERLLLSKN
jgi:2-polyprenyl-6-methoxyphenol hydroxylase-like FAD-dependent oxidoreductase